MNEQLMHDLLLEPERYELWENPELLEQNRRTFFKIAGAGVVVALFLNDADLLAQPPQGRQRGQGGGGGAGPTELGAWLHIGEDSKITVYTGKVEIGQNIRTSLTQAVAEELHVPVSRIEMVMADTDRVPFDGGTAGSQSTPRMAPQLRKVGAAARELLFDLAAEESKIDRSKFAIVDGKVVDPQSKTSFEFGQLTKGKKLMKAIAQDVKTTAAKDWKVAGTPVLKVDGRAFVTGGHQYASDIRRPGMLHGKVLRPPSYKATLESVDTRAAEAVAGAKIVRDGDFIGVVAPTEHAATQALALIKAQWKEQPQVGSDELYKHLKQARGGGGGGGGGGFGGGADRAGSVADGLAAADHKIDVTYNIAYIAHSPLEPRAAVAEIADDKITVWTGTQRPFGVKTEVANAVKMPADKVRVIVPDMGAGYGGKHTGDAAVEAAKLAKAVGKPVKLVWTREEEFTWAYFRPAGVIDIKAGVKKDGTITAWEFHNYNSGGSALRTPYDVPNRQCEMHASDSPLRQGSYRALASTANNFAREMAMDELCRAVQMDPVAFRLKQLKDARIRGVLEAAAKAFGWDMRKKTDGHGIGIACGTEKNSFVATCAEVMADPATGRFKVIRAVTAFDCGAVVNPEHLKNQIEGAVVMGLGGALYEAIQFANGKIVNPRFSQYRVPRFADVPVMETILVDRKDQPAVGAGETPIIAIAPAVGSAIFDACGLRLRSLPMIPNGLKEAAKG